jgi:hypothetical protein
MPLLDLNRLRSHVGCRPSVRRVDQSFTHSAE